MKKIMFVCTGNTCRSAMAEAFLKDIANKKNIDVEVYSSGIYAQNGEAATSNSIEVMKQYNIDMVNHKATNIKDSNINKMDLILCATKSHKYIVVQMYPNMKDKIYTLKEYVGNDKQDLDIADPWGNNRIIYDKCAKEIKENIEKLIEKL